MGAMNKSFVLGHDALDHDLIREGVSIPLNKTGRKGRPHQSIGDIRREPGSGDLKVEGGG